ncbi:786_t:CDS:2, partial [Dentiscutata heterogama]
RLSQSPLLDVWAQWFSRKIIELSCLIIEYYRTELISYIFNSYARILKYAASTEFIPKYSYKFDNFHKKYGTPFNALLAQFIYCSIFLLLFFDPTKDLFDFVAETSQIIALMFHVASAICLFILRKDPSNFQLPKWIIVIYLIFVILIVSTSFFPPGPGSMDHYILYVLPYVFAMAATLLGGIIWKFRNYSENLEDSEITAENAYFNNF